MNKQIDSGYQHTAGDLLVASVQQQGIWFHAVSHTWKYWDFINVRSYRGIMDIHALRKALDTVIRRHSSLRTRFTIRDNELFQQVSDDFDLDDVYYQAVYDCDYGEEAIRLVNKDIDRLREIHFQPEQDLLFRFRVIQFRDSVFMVLLINHIIADHVSGQIFWSDLRAYYNFYHTTAAGDHTLPTSKQYLDFSREQESFLQSPVFESQQAYWLNKFALGIPALQLPFCSNKNTGVIWHRDLELPIELVKDIKTFALKNRIVYSSIYHFAYVLLLNKYSGQTRIAIGNMFNGRRLGKTRYDDTIGLLANRIINIYDLDTTAPVVDGIKKVNAELINSFSNSDVPYEVLARQYNNSNRSGMAPLFQAFFNLIKYTGDDEVFSGLTALADQDRSDMVNYDSQYDIYLCVIEKEHSATLRVALRSDPHLFQVIDLMLETYRQLLEACIYRPNTIVADIDWLCPRDKQLMHAYSDTFRHSEETELVHELFLEQVNKGPHQVAILAQGQEITYHELNRQANVIAGSLIAAGIKKNSIIGVWMKRSPLLFPCILGILKAGAAYLPLDPSYPQARLLYMLQDAGAQYVITQAEVRPQVTGITLLDINDLLAEQNPATNAARSLPDDPVYIIYTSGSTGQPKGVAIGHRAVVNFIRSMMEQGTFPKKKIYCLTNFSFDMFVFESLLPLCSGGTVVLADENEQKSMAAIIKRISSGDVEVLQATPSRIKLLLNESPECFQYFTDVISGGETFPADMPEKIKKHFSGNLYNMYGPTETTVYSTAKNITHSNDIPLTIGKPLLNTGIYILNDLNEIQGIGIPGEICISGHGLANGYLGQPEKNKEKFIYISALPGVRLYKSGDVGRLLPNGELEILGRKDDQIKIRGYRIEPADIEYSLKTHPQIKDAVVVLKNNDSYDELVAFYVCDQAIAAVQLRNHLNRFVPGFMVPDRFIWKNKFPLTINGKTDKKSLLCNLDELVIEPPVSNAGMDADADLLDIWFNTLQVEEMPASVDMTANFFESGGHSLKALHLLEMVEKKLGVKIAVRDFFQFPTLEFLQKQLLTVAGNIRVLD